MLYARREHVAIVVRNRIGRTAQRYCGAIEIRSAFRRPVGDADLTAFLYSRGCFDASFAASRAIDDLVAPICGEGVSDRIQKAFELVEDATKLILAGDRNFGMPAPDMVMKHYASTDPPPEWWGKSRDNYLGAMNEMYRANTRARDGGRSYTLYFARRFEFAFEYMNSLEAVRKAALPRAKEMLKRRSPSWKRRSNH